MRLRRTVVGLLLLVAAAACSAVVWDFFQFGRKVPEQVPVDARATLIVVDKSARRLTLFRNGDALKSYKVALGSAPRGHKQQEGDGRTPEGRYTIDFKNARSRFHLALRVSYPNDADRERAHIRGVSPGGDIMIHGLPNGLGWLAGVHLWRDWTDGCVAVTDSEVDEIWPLVDVGTKVDIRP
jgi:murein L,D-transpeptidase YafK